MEVNREYKDRLFCKLFGDPGQKENLLSLYNALNGTDYTDVSGLEINTLEDVVYMGFKNDVSCILDGNMMLNEHQSTFNPNMPVRGVLYFGRLYDKYIKECKYNKYGEKLIKLPTPKYYILYNGTKDEPDQLKLKLSDAFIKPDKSGEFEWTATMLNINYGHNKKLLEECKLLGSYSQMVYDVRVYKKQGYKNEAAVDAAVSDAIKRKDSLGNYLKQHKSEVVGMLLTEYDEEETMAMFKKEYYEDGFADGEAKGKAEGKAEGEAERKALEEKIAALQKENERLKTSEK